LGSLSLELRSDGGSHRHSLADEDRVGPFTPAARLACHVTGTDCAFITVLDGTRKARRSGLIEFPLERLG